MVLKRFTYFVLFFSSVVFSQEKNNLINVSGRLSNKEVLDSLKTTFVHDEIASCIDSLWMKELTSLDIYDELTLDIATIDIDQKVDYELPTKLLKERLKKLDEKSPFKIEYNQGLENVIKSFLKNRKQSFERLMGLSQYYFPIFEESLSARKIPLEIKYLSVVESALNPRAVSRVGATGLWQFMYQTGKQYELKVDSYVDERQDPVKASKAATQYMENMYKIFGDWDLVLASYNAGPGNVSKAIRRSGGKQNYWNIRKYLPKETQGYLPAFLATMYIFEYHKEHGITPNKAVFNNFTTDTVLVKKALTFKQISDLLDVSEAELKFLNPIYKINQIPYITGENHYLKLPINKIAIFTSNEDKLYAYVDYLESKKEKQNVIVSLDNDTSSGRVKDHKVKRGESLGIISKKYGVTVSEIKKWNGLKSNNIAYGRSLKVSKYMKPTIVEKKVIETIVEETTEEIATTENSSTNEVYEVMKGDNLLKIAEKFNVGIEDLKNWNNLESNIIKVGDNLVVSKKENAENEIASTTQDISTIKKNNENHYFVKSGDSLYSISKKFPGVSISDIKKWNGIKNENIKPGMKLKING